MVCTRESTRARSFIARPNDPLSRLSLELVIDIFGHLRILSIFNLRRVNRKWRDILSSTVVVNAAVSRWKSHEPVEFGEPLHSRNEPLESRLQHMKAFKTMQPWSTRIFDDVGVGPKFKPIEPRSFLQRVALKGKRIAYITYDEEGKSCVVLRDLVSGEQSTVQSRDGEEIISIVLTTSLVACLTRCDDKLYAHYCQHTPMEKPWSRINGLEKQGEVRAFGADGNIVVIDFGSGIIKDTNIPYSSRLVIINAEEDSAIVPPYVPALPIERGSSIHTTDLVIDARRQTIFFFYSWNQDWPNVADHMDDLIMDCCEVNFDGDLIRQTYSYGNVSSSFASCNCCLRRTYFAMPPTPTGIDGEFRNGICTVSTTKQAMPFQMLLAGAYSCTKGHWVKRENIFDNYGDGTMCMFWKGELFCRPGQEDWHEYTCYTNGTFVVSFEVNKLDTRRTRIRVDCFDPEVHFYQEEILE